MNKKAIVLSSGGLDSTTCLSIALKEGYEVYPLTFLYGQKHSQEVEQAKLIRRELKIPEENHLFVNIDNIGRSALTSAELNIPDKDEEGIPDTYVPARNILFLSYAVSLAESIEAEAVYIGVSSIDYSGYPDCRPEFINTYQEVINVGTKRGVEGNPVQIKTPLIDKTKVETIEMGLELDAPYYLTTTCYRGREKACGNCPACEIRLKAFAEVGVEDPIQYEEIK